METKNTAINIRLTFEQKAMIDYGAKTRGVDRTSYIMRLVEEDLNQSNVSLYRKKTADSIRKVTEDIYGMILEANAKNEYTREDIQSLLGGLEEGVKQLWRCLK